MSYEGGRTPPQTLGSLEAPWSPRGNPANESATRRANPHIYGGGPVALSTLAGGGPPAALPAPPAALPASPADVAAALAANGYERESNPLAYQEADLIATNFNNLDVFKDIFLANNVLNLPTEDEHDAFIDLEKAYIGEADDEFGQISRYLIEMLEYPFSLDVEAGTGGAGAGGAGVEGGAGRVNAPDETRINKLISLANEYDSELAYLSSSFEDAKGISVASAFGSAASAASAFGSAASAASALSAASAASALSAASDASIIKSQQKVEEITNKTDTMIKITQELFQGKSDEKKDEVKKEITRRRKSALEKLLAEAESIKMAPTGRAAEEAAEASASAAAAANARHQAALQKRRKTLQGKVAAAAAAAAAAGAESVAGLSHTATGLTLGLAIQVPLVGQRIEGSSPDDQARFAHSSSILNQRDVHCDICDRIIREKFQFDHSLPVNYEAFTSRIFLGYTYNNRKSMIQYWEGELIHLIQFLGGPAHQSCNGSKGKKKGLTCPKFNKDVGFSMLDYNIPSLLDITYTKLVNDPILVKDVLHADLPAAIPAEIKKPLDDCLKEHPNLNNSEIQQITYYILQRLSFSVAKLRPVKHFMKTNLDYTKVNDRLKYVRRKQAEAKAKVGVVTAATDAAAESANVETVSNEHVERLASARAAIEALRGTEILPYNDGFKKGQQINFHTPNERDDKFPQLPFFRPTNVDDGVLPSMIWKNTESSVPSEKIKQIQNLLQTNHENILVCVRQAFNLVHQPDGVGPAAEAAIRAPQKSLRARRPEDGADGADRDGANSASKRADLKGAGSGTGSAVRQRKTRFRKRQTQKRKTRKNRKQRK